MSGAYLNAEFTAEFGQLPPSFLPVGNRRLYEWQLDLFAGDRVILTLPSNFEVPSFDRDVLDGTNAEILTASPGLSLGAAIAHCLETANIGDEVVRILFGDTLLHPDLGLEDVVSVAETSEYYNWAELVPNTKPLRFTEGFPDGATARKVVCGYFAFSRPKLLLECLVGNDFDFVRGLTSYSESQPLAPVETGSWLDFGHIQTYFQSKSRMTTQRWFNRLSRGGKWITKSSNDAEKISAEGAWFVSLPDEMKIYVPTFAPVRSGTPEYQTEYLNLSTLSELYVFGRLPARAWMRVLGGCDDFLLAARQYAVPDTTSRPTRQSYVDKTLRRLESFARDREGVDLESVVRFGGRPLPSLRRLVELCGSLIPDARPDDMAIWHGDFCFSNIFYDFRAERIRTIDPRGLDFEGNVSVYGDRRYDVAKLAHSVVGRYDFILTQRYRMTPGGFQDFDLELPDELHLQQMEAQFKDMEIGGYRTDSPWILAMTVTLFLSMLPLHADAPERQRAFLANGLRLASILLG